MILPTPASTGSNSFIIINVHAKFFTIFILYLYEIHDYVFKIIHYSLIWLRLSSLCPGAMGEGRLRFKDPSGRIHKSLLTLVVLSGMEIGGLGTDLKEEIFMCIMLFLLNFTLSYKLKISRKNKIN